MIKRLSRVGIAVVLLAGVLWAGGVAEARRLPSAVTVCVDASSGVVRRVASSSVCAGGTQFWSASKPAPLLCWDASSVVRLNKTRLVSVASASGCVAPLRAVPVGKLLLLCADGKTGVLRWSVTRVCASGRKQTWVRSAATPTTVATTISTTSTTAVVVPSVSLSATWIQGGTFPKAVTVTTNVVGTIYFAEGDFVVKTVADITSAPSYRWAKGTVTSANTPTSIAIDVDAVTHGYYRVYVAISQGVLSAPATNIVTISVPRTPTAAEIAAGTTTTTTTTTVALTCAQGGTCAVGDTGPGGGLVFYVRASGTFACGATLASTCKYLEAAPTTGISAWTDVSIAWATGGNQSSPVSGADGTAIGTGYQNTSDIVAQSGNVAATSAAVKASEYRGPNSLSDWFLPSKDELNQMCKWARGQAWTSDATQCSSGGTINTAPATGFSTGTYWSSSEYDAYLAWHENFTTGTQANNAKDYLGYVRLVRAF
ncbi:MAG: hypothetical protein QNL08_04910 [Ilumatobacteraceae bacterium]